MKWEDVKVIFIAIWARVPWQWKWVLNVLQNFILLITTCELYRRFMNWWLDRKKHKAAEAAKKAKEKDLKVGAVPPDVIYVDPKLPNEKQGKNGSK